MDMCKLKSLHFIILFSIFTYCLADWDFDDEDNDCKPTETCKMSSHCPQALESITATGDPNLKRCGFEKNVELVCCPNKDVGNNLPRISIKRRCERACEDLSRMANRSGVIFHIIDGEDAEIKDFPHMAILGYDLKEEGIQWNCGASIISQRYLLTAAHCIASTLGVKPSIARMGVTKLNDTNPKDYKITNTIVNNKYSTATKHNDIALIEVQKNIKFSETVAPACLYFENDNPQGLVITGWGKTKIGTEDDRSNTLQKAVVVPVPLRECNISYFTRTSGSKDIDDTQICAASETSDACLGDSGGPLQKENKEGTYSVVGIISYGAGCGGRVAGVYTRVSKFIDWIENIVWPVK